MGRSGLSTERQRLLQDVFCGGEAGNGQRNWGGVGVPGRKGMIRRGEGWKTRRNHCDWERGGG